MRDRQFSTFLSWRKFFRSLLLNTEQNLLQSFKKQEILQFEMKKKNSNLTVPLRGPTPKAFYTIFSGKYILRKKTSATRDSKNQSHQRLQAVEGVCYRLKEKLYPQLHFFKDSFNSTQLSNKSYIQLYFVELTVFRNHMAQRTINENIFIYSLKRKSRKMKKHTT